jgi:hypothetical protein
MIDPAKMQLNIRKKKIFTMISRPSLVKGSIINKLKNSDKIATSNLTCGSQKIYESMRKNRNSNVSHARTNKK